MATWIRNGPCPQCGSRDNLGIYDDGSCWCWGCHYYSSRTRIPTGEVNEQPRRHKSLPDDFGNFFGPDSVNWFSKYDFDVPTLLQRGVGYSALRNQTIFTFKNIELWQARNHNPSRVKYFTSGNHDDVLPIYPHVAGPNVDSTVVLTEDCLSAIKIASLKGLEAPRFDAMPLLGTHLATKKLIGLNRLYSRLVVWLDHDKGKEAQHIAERARLLGMGAKVISTELDPKEYDNETLAYFLSADPSNRNHVGKFLPEQSPNLGI